MRSKRSICIITFTCLWANVRGTTNRYSSERFKHLRILFDKDEWRHRQTAEPIAIPEYELDNYITPSPTTEPTYSPTTPSPTMEPTDYPTQKPTSSPSLNPTTSSPTSPPTTDPTQNPTPHPIPAVAPPSESSELTQGPDGGLSLSAFAVGGAAVLILVGVIVGRRLTAHNEGESNVVEDSGCDLSEVSQLPGDQVVLEDSVELRANERSFNPLDCSGSVTVNSISFV